MKYILSENDKYISITVSSKEDKSLSWEQLQTIKDKYYPDLDFIEVYPKKNEIINKANERHLIHIRKDFICPKLWNLEIDSDVKIIEDI